MNRAIAIVVAIALPACDSQEAKRVAPKVEVVPVVVDTVDKEEEPLEPPGSDQSSPDCSSTGGGRGRLNGLRYLERVWGEDPSVPMPMVVVFHSRGGVPGGATSYFPGIEGPLRVIRPAGFHHTSGGGYNWMTKSSKRDPAGFAAEMQQGGDRLAKFIADMAQCRPTLGRPIVTGRSAGGHWSYYLANAHPHIVGGAVAISGYVPPQFWNPRMAPTLGLHATGDNTIPFKRTQSFWDAMKVAGAPLETETFPGGHGGATGMSQARRGRVRELVDQQRTGAP